MLSVSHQTIARVLAAAPLDPVDARALLRHTLGVDAAYLIAHAGQTLTDAQGALFSALVARRRAGEPVAYIVGAREFFGLEFKVTPAVLIPRPETELLVEFALERIAPERACRVLDLGTGSGCVAVSIAKHRPLARVVAVDRSTAALAVARDNVRQHAVTNLELLESDWFDALAGQRFDVIVANPPYVAADDPHLKQGDLRFEPAAALAAGADGLDCIRLIIAAAPQYLSGGGWLVFEHGYDQAARGCGLLTASGFAAVFSRADLAGIERVSGGQWRGGLDAAGLSR
jgi:release factor glutamine methyltransferase